LRTNLLPKEIIRNRLIREKKPWAVAAAAVLLLACSLGFAAHSLSVATVNENRKDWQERGKAAASVKSKSDG